MRHVDEPLPSSSLAPCRRTFLFAADSVVCLYVLFPEASSGLFFLSQRPYIPQASLRQQVLYPTPSEKAVQVTDEHIQVSVEHQ
jgi:hypothetical protein